ncbi:DUF4249 domain-containing protein [Wenyingzhuangia aestuarii]|uniref:DUF4249 family protein n=1 Tax=Wenyingzhuangia aestuarii TaxID=1647582 RepID=UPI0014396553|nr:DUF4249 family protein [Wenyingzhuangia aestuarii]NJB81802.1 hypothetical protein [Wenyingzhuangia aestuarii]
MKKYIYLLVALFSLISCVDEVTIDELNKVETRLVIEAHMDIDKNNGAPTTTQTIKLTNTSSFYNQNYPTVSGATISMTNQTNTSVATFTETTEAGIYEATDFVTPSIGDIYTLTITVNGEVYTAQDTYTSIIDINEITQETVTLTEEVIQVNINIDNQIGVDNYYLFQVETPYRNIPEYGNLDDKLISEKPGENNYDFVILDDELKKDMDIDITIYGISNQYNNYLSKLLALAQESGGPFATAPATIRGNILNTTNQDNYALGFFSLNQFVKKTYKIK